MTPRGIRQRDMNMPEPQGNEKMAEWRGRTDTRVEALENDFQAFQNEVRGICRDQRESHREEVNRLRQEMRELVTDLKTTMREQVTTLAQSQANGRAEVNMNIERMGSRIELEMGKMKQDVSQMQQSIQNELKPLQKWVYMAMGVIVLALLLWKVPAIVHLFRNAP